MTGLLWSLFLYALAGFGAGMGGARLSTGDVIEILWWPGSLVNAPCLLVMVWAWHSDLGAKVGLAMGALALLATATVSVLFVV